MLFFRTITIVTALSLLGSSLSVGIIAAPITVFGQQQQQLSNAATDGGLSASVDKSNYNPGDTVIINGTVAKNRSSSFVVVEVIDPNGRMVEDGRPHISALAGFRFTFTAGELQQFDPNHWMRISG